MILSTFWRFSLFSIHWLFLLNTDKRASLPHSVQCHVGCRYQRIPIDTSGDPTISHSTNLVFVDQFKASGIALFQKLWILSNWADSVENILGWQIVPTSDFCFPYKVSNKELNDITSLCPTQSGTFLIQYRSCCTMNCTVDATSTK